MTTHFTPDVDFMTHTLEDLAHLKEELPEAMHHFSALSIAALQEGALSKKTKVLMALLISIMQHSNACIKFHLYELIQHDLTHSELLEVVALAMYMGGGPAYMSAQYALKMFEQHHKKEEE